MAIGDCSLPYERVVALVIISSDHSDRVCLVFNKNICLHKVRRSVIILCGREKSAS